MSKNTLNWYDRDNPKRIAVAKYRSPEQEQKENVMDDFMLFLKCDLDDDLPESAFVEIQTLINKFLNRDLNKVKQGEQEMLASWIEASQTK